MILNKKILNIINFSSLDIINIQIIKFYKKINKKLFNKVY